MFFGSFSAVFLPFSVRFRPFSYRFAWFSHNFFLVFGVVVVATSFSSSSLSSGGSPPIVIARRRRRRLAVFMDGPSVGAAIWPSTAVGLRYEAATSILLQKKKELRSCT